MEIASDKSDYFPAKFPRDDIIPALLLLYFLWYKIVIPWQHRDYRTLTSLSLGLRPRELGQLSTIIPQNHGITIAYLYIGLFLICMCALVFTN